MQASRRLPRRKKCLVPGIGHRARLRDDYRWRYRPEWNSATCPTRRARTKITRVILAWKRLGEEKLAQDREGRSRALCRGTSAPGHRDRRRQCHSHEEAAEGLSGKRQCPGLHRRLSYVGRRAPNYLVAGQKRTDRRSRKDKRMRTLEHRGRANALPMLTSGSSSEYLDGRVVVPSRLERTGLSEPNAQPPATLWDRFRSPRQILRKRKFSWARLATFGNSRLQKFKCQFRKSK